jgi:streptogramin lyase
MSDIRRRCAVIVVLAAGLACFFGTTAARRVGASDTKVVPGTASLSGRVDAPKPFKAAQVRLMNVDKKIVEYDLPMRFSEPYDVWPDRDDRIWISDGGQGGALIRFEPRTEKFSYYPTPQTTDQPKLAITRGGAIWYTPRSSLKAAVGVLYPDMDTITTLAAHY